MLTMIEAKVSGLFIGNNSREQIEVDLEGIIGDKHRGFVKDSDVRDESLPKKIPVQNWRQWSGVAKEELAVIAQRLALPSLEACLFDANIEFTGVDKFTQLPPGTKLWFPQDTILKVEEDNEPCTQPGRKIAEVYPSVNPSDFVKAAWGLRGLVGTTFRAGVISVGDIVRVERYKPRTYSLP